MADQPIVPGQGLVPVPGDPARDRDADLAREIVIGQTHYQDPPYRGIDRASYQILNALFAKDAKMVYYRCGKFPKADPASFRVLDPGFYREPVEYSLDYPQSHGMPHFQGYARDDRDIYHYVLTIGKPSAIRGADLDTFTILRFGYAQDRNHVYHERLRVKGAKPGDFRQINPYYSTGGKAVYYLSEVLEGADPGSFQVLRNGLALDASRVYLQGKPIEGADPETYEAIGWSTIGKDRHRVYAHWWPIERADRDTFVAVGGSYQKDKDRVYYQGKPIPKADPKSIRFLGDSRAEDDHRQFNGGMLIRGE
jgi:hypothetical protein